MKQFCCFVCGKVLPTANDFKKHIVESHEQGREYLLCPVKYCEWPCRDIRYHMRLKHPACKLPKTCQLRATIMYDVSQPGKPRKLPTFKEGFIISKKNNKQFHYRSSYEEKVLLALEKMPEVIAYSVEPFSIPYFYKGRQRQYFPDLKVEFTDRTEIWEIKPKNQTKSAQNIAKWTSCRAFCLLRGWNFEVITESTIQDIQRRV